MARSLGLGLGRSGCSGCGRGARCALLLRLRPLLPRTLLSGSGACVLRLSAACIRAGARLSSTDAWISSAGTRPWLAAWRFRWGPSVTGHITRKPEPISETTANVITAPEWL